MEEVKSRRQEYAELTRAAVLAAATTLFAEQGYVQTSLEQVAAAARVSKGTVYAHFEGKQELFKAAQEDLERRLNERLVVIAAQHDDPWEGGVAALRAFLDACCDSEYGHVVMREGPVALSYVEWLQCAEPYSFGLVRTLLTALVDVGEVAPLPLETASRLVHSMLGSAAVLIADARGAGQAEARRDAETVVLRLLDGLRTRPAD